MFNMYKNAKYYIFLDTSSLYYKKKKKNVIYTSYTSSKKPII